MSWSESFKGYIDAQALSQAEVATALKVPPSAVSYWCRGATPRAKTRRRIERWSKGAIPAEAAAAPLHKAARAAAPRTGTDG